MSSTQLPSRADTVTSQRYQVVDILRGFALCGILLVNIGDITRLGHDLPVEVGRTVSATEIALYYVVSTRFVPIFALLFGMSLAFVADSARRRGVSPGPVLCRRLAALLLIGLAHGLIYPGEVLREFAVIGLLVLPVVLFTPRRLGAALGIIGTIATFGWLGATSFITAPLFLLGAAAVSYGIPPHAGTSPAGSRDRHAGAVPPAVAAIGWQTTETGDPRFGYAGGIAGGESRPCSTSASSPWPAPPAGRPAGAAGTDVLDLLRHASAIVAALGTWAHWSTSRAVEPLLAAAVVVLVVQSIAARLWLRHFRYGPLEWGWRCLTWWRRQPLARR